VVWRVWLRGGRVAGLDGCGLPVTPDHLWDASPKRSLAPGP
jgi:hypothetical protein